MLGIKILGITNKIDDCKFVGQLQQMGERVAAVSLTSVEYSTS